MKLQKLTASAENSKEIRQLLAAFELVEASTNYEKDFLRGVISKNTRDDSVIQLSNDGRAIKLQRLEKTFSNLKAI